MIGWSRWRRTHNQFHKASTDSFICMLPDVLIDCSSFAVYACGTYSSVITQTEWTPDFCKLASGVHSVCCCLQLPTSIQQSEPFIPPDSSLFCSAGKKDGWTECILFISNVLCFQNFPPCILLAFKSSTQGLPLHNNSYVLDCFHLINCHSIKRKTQQRR